MALTAAALAIAAIAIIIWVRRHPFELFAFLTRRALKKAGLERKTRDGIVYWVGGDAAETLVLLHGTNDQAGTWSPIVPTLLSRYRLVIPDLPGHGESIPSEGPLTIPQIAAGFAQLMEAVTDSKPVTLVGNSMGGWIAMLYSLEYPQKVKKLILEDSGGMSWDLTGIPLVPQTREQAALAMRLVLGPSATIPPAYVLDAMVRRARTAPMLRLIQGGSDQHSIDNRLADVKPPVTMIWGAGDGVLPLSYAEVLRSRIPNAKLHVIDECGHIPHRQKPKQFVTLLQEAIGV